MNYLIRRYCICCFLLVSSFVSAESSIDSSSVKRLETSVGKVLLSFNSHVRYDYSKSNPFGIAEPFSLFKKEYDENIKNLPVDYRVDYFWFALWYMGLQGGFMTEFQDMVAKDCLDEFVNKLEQFVSVESNLQRNKTRLRISKLVLNDLKRAKKIKNIGEGFK